MYYASKRLGLAILDTFENEIVRRISVGDSLSFLYIVPTSAQARDLINRITAIKSDRAIILPKILSLAEAVTRIRQSLRPDIELLSSSQAAAMLELTLRELFESDALQYFESRGSTIGSLPVFQGTFDEIAATIKGLKERGITSERLQDSLDKERKLGESSNTEKLADILTIFDAYNRKLGNLTTDEHGQYSIIAAEIEAKGTQAVAAAFNRVFSGVRDVYIAPFISLAQPAVDLLIALSKLDRISMCFALDSDQFNEELFRNQLALEAQLVDAGFRIDAPTEIIDSPRSAYIRRHLFNRMRLNTALEDSDIRSIEAPSMEAELRAIARAIKKILTTTLNDPANICVATSDQERYAPMARAVFAEYGIPTQLTQRPSLDASPLFQSVEALLELGEFHLSKKRIRSILESPYFILRDSEGSIIEGNELLRAINRPGKYHFRQGARQWHSELDGYLEDIAEMLEAGEFDDPIEERQLQNDEDELRSARADMLALEALTAELSLPRTPAEFVAKMKQLLISLEVLPSILSESDALITAAALELETRAYAVLLEQFDELLRLTAMLGLSSKKLEPRFYLERLRAAASRARYSVRAEPGSAVIVTSFDQTIGNSFEHLFIAGLRDGLYPRSYRQSLFTPTEYSHSHRDHTIEQRFLFYQTLCTSKNYIYLSWHTGSAEGSKAFTKSSMVTALEAVVKITPLKDEQQKILCPSEFYQHIGSTFERSSIAERLALFDRAASAGMDTSLLRRFSTTATEAVDIEQLRRTTYESKYSGVLPLEELDEQERERLEAYRDHVYSVSQLETYAKCGFKYFSQYLLQLSTTDRAEEDEGLDASERGSMLHKTLYTLLDRCKERKLNIREMGSDATILAAEVLDELYPPVRTKKLHPFARLDRERLFESRDAAGSLIEQFIAHEQSDSIQMLLAKPKYFELVFGNKHAPERKEYPNPNTPIELDGIKLRGKIDRIDMDEAGHFIIVDYKSGKGASRADIKKGQSLQLPLYLRIAEDMLRAHLGEDKAYGIGALYHSLKHGEHKREFRLRLSHELAKDIIEKTADHEQYKEVDKMTEFIDSVIAYAKGYVEGISHGEFPLVSEDRRGNCTFCDFGPVCRVNQAEVDGVLPKD